MVVESHILLGIFESPKTKNMNWTKNNSGWVDGTGKKIETAPIQTSKYDDTVPRLVAEEAYKEYAALYGTTQSLDRLCERGGFAASEIAGLLYRRIKRLESSLPNV